MSKLRVIVETPFAASTPDQRLLNDGYLNLCLLDSLNRGEAPFASHGFYPRVLDDEDRSQRALGIAAGLAWATSADLTAVYTDLGISPGMQAGIEHAERYRRKIDMRTLPPQTIEDLKRDTHLHALSPHERRFVRDYITTAFKVDN